MLEPPSDELQQRLRSWQLCLPADLRRARRIVQRLARDLPAFDSVWIDALVQLGRLTPYQARILESDAPSSLRVGDVLLLDEIGRSAWGRTWLGRSTGRRELCVLKRVSAPVEKQAGIAEQGRRLVSSALAFSHPHLVAPTGFSEDRDGCAFVSPYVGGIPLSELLVRRGRFPALIVAELARQLATGLHAWHRHGQVHGDVRLSHVRIESDGRAVLVEAGLRPVIEPEITLHAALSLEAYDGVAPELVGIGQIPGAASDLYALGCLLWQLLSGRPPFAVADPLAKLAAHQTRTIEDVREWAPETPAILADVIARLVRRAAAERPQSAEEVERELSQLRLPGRGAIRAFRRQFDLAVPHLRQDANSSKWSWTAGATAVAAMIAVATLLSDRDRRQELLALSGGRWQSTSVSAESSAEPMIDASSGLLPLPSPAADGTLILSESGPYSTATLRYAGQLHIRGAAGVCPEILIRDQPLRLACESLVIENVRIRRDSLWLGAETPRALALVQTQRITLRDCEWDTGQAHPRRPKDAPVAGIAWRLIEPLDATAGQLSIANALFRGAGTAIFANDAARRVIADNVLRLGQGSWLELQSTENGPPPDLQLTHMTLREASSLVHCRTHAVTPARRLLRITTNDCVFSLKSQSGALVVLETAETPSLGPDALVWNGVSSLIPPETSLVKWSAPAEDQLRDVSTDEMLIDGLVAGGFTFVGPPTASIADSVLETLDVPRESLDPPGILQERFGVCLGGAPAVAPVNISLDPRPLP